MRAIIIDPSRSYRKLLTGSLTSNRVDVDEAASIADARTLLMASNYDLICMAMTLPDGDSAKFCLQVRALPHYGFVPILMFTGDESPEATRRCLAAGATVLFRRQEYDSFGAYVSRLLDRRHRGGQVRGTILYLEDSKSVALKTKQELVSQGFNVDLYSRAEDGITAFEAKDYDLVLTDIVLEGQMSGVALLEAVRRHDDPTKRTVPVVAMSGYDDASRRVQLFRAGINDYVTKPVLEEELLARVRNLISNRHLLNELAESHERLKRLAMTDQLTGLRNRHYVNENAPAYIRTALTGNQPLSLVVTDIDRFKLINDKHGHDVGDTVMMALGALLSESARPQDIVARMGGEEFMLLLPGCDADAGVERAETLRQALMQLKPAGLDVTASFGVTSLRLGDDFNKLFKRADNATYTAKEAGRNCVKSA